MESLFQDLRYGIRMMWNSPGFTLVAVLTLALGIGANTAIFTVVNGVLLRLPFPEPERLVVVQNTYPQAATPASFPDFMDWREEAGTFDGLAAIFRRNLTYVDGTEPQRLRSAYISEDYLKVTGVAPLLGRASSTDEHRRGAARVCMLGEAFWQGQLGGERSVVGRSLTLGDFQCTVIGVLPARTPTLYDGGISVWMPLEAAPPYDQRGTNYLSVVGRLSSGTGIEQARQRLEQIQAGINTQFPGNTHGIRVAPLTDELLGNTRAPLLLLLAAVGIVLLIACANVANLLLARGAVRQKEFALREALGARRLRLVRQLLTETAMMAALAAGAGLFLGVWAVHLFERYWPQGIPVPKNLEVDARVLGFTIITAALATLISALLPALRSSRVDLNLTLKAAGQRGGGSAADHRTRAGFVVGEIALAWMLLVAGLLMIRSLDRLLAVDPGFNSEGLVVMDITRPAGQTPEQRRAFYDQLIPRLRSVPGIAAVGATTYVPFSGGGQSGDFAVEGREFPSGQSPFADQIYIRSGYFDAMGINLLQGRDFNEQDRADAPPVIIVNRTMAERLWPGESALGKRIRVNLPPTQWQQVVGVVEDVRNEGLEGEAAWQTYLPWLQSEQGSLAMVVRSRVEPEGVIGALKQEVYALDRAQPVQTTLLEQLVMRSVSHRRATALLLSGFAALSMVLAVIGIYGVIAYTVTQRTHEIGIRMALGAGRRQIQGMVVSGGLRMAFLGVGVGTLAALLLSRFLRGLLFGIASTDVLTYVGAGLLLFLAALLASYIPARRATRVDPLVALRYE
jgi:putative ABC transport system permease protein